MKVIAPKAPKTAYWRSTPTPAAAVTVQPSAHSGGMAAAHTHTTRQLVEVIYRLAGQPKTKLRSTPAFLLRALGVTNPTVRELLELQYEFQEPFIVDSAKIAAKLAVHATPLDQALAGTLAAYRTSPAS